MVVWAGLVEWEGAVFAKLSSPIVLADFSGDNFKGTGRYPDSPQNRIEDRSRVWLWGMPMGVMRDEASPIRHCCRRRPV